MRVSIFLVLILLLANSCGTPGLDRPGDHGSTSSTGSSSTGDKRPALCSDIKDDVETKCKAAAAKEGDCFYVNYNNQDSCVSQKNKREFMKDKTCGGILNVELCHGTVVGPMADPKVCREGISRCEQAPSYAHYASKCMARDATAIQNAVESTCSLVPVDKCDGEVVTFSFVKVPIKAKLCKVSGANGKDKCIVDQGVVNQHAQDLAKEFCDYQINSRKGKDLRQYFANKDNSGLVHGYSEQICRNGSKLGMAPYKQFISAAINGLCQADLSGKK